MASSIADYTQGLYPDSETTALVVIDPQRGYADPSCPGDSVAAALGWDVTSVSASLDRLVPFVDEMRKYVLVIFTQMDESLANRPQNLPADPSMNTDLCVPGTESYGFFKVVPKPGDLIVQKRSMSAFGQTNLDQRLQSHGIKTLILTGAYTSRCVNDTARSAANHGYNVIICEDMVANPPHLEKYSQRDLNELRLSIGFTADSEEVLKYFRKETDHILFYSFDPKQV